jgi:hypothetical protein
LGDPKWLGPDEKGCGMRVEVQAEFVKFLSNCRLAEIHCRSPHRSHDVISDVIIRDKCDFRVNGQACDRRLTVRYRCWVRNLSRLKHQVIMCCSARPNPGHVAQWLEHGNTPWALGRGLSSNPRWSNINYNDLVIYRLIVVGNKGMARSRQAGSLTEI